MSLIVKYVHKITNDKMRVLARALLDTNLSRGMFLMRCDHILGITTIEEEIVDSGVETQ